MPFSSTGYDVLRIETDLVASIPSINLQREHQVINTRPWNFRNGTFGCGCPRVPLSTVDSAEFA